MPRPDDLPDPSLFGASLVLRGALPLQGLTVLAVEDSRYACDALRLMCQRSGARLRRADSLAAAEAHLRCYRPDVVIVDLGLPDGRGEVLIRSLAQQGRMVVLGSSGDPDGRAAALAAGAAGFLDKPVPGLAVFQATILAHLPGAEMRPAPFPGEVRPDPLALTDDLLQAAEALEAGPSPAERAYLAGFVSGLARQTHDTALASAGRAIGDPAMAGDDLSLLLRARIARDAAFRDRA
jgi:DNA-binding response OmpR family regulator